MAIVGGVMGQESGETRRRQPESRVLCPAPFRWHEISGVTLGVSGEVDEPGKGLVGCPSCH